MSRIVAFSAALVLVSAVGFGQKKVERPSAATSASSAPATTRAVPEPLTKAIAVMRNVDQSRISLQERRARALQMSSAWKTLISAGPRGTEALRAELDALDQARQKDDFFRLAAAALLWRIGKTDHAGRIAAIWSGTPVKVQYQYTFATAMAAAGTQDPKVLPMLSALLRDDQGVFLNPMHAMRMGWPMNLEFIWGRFGRGGLPRLREALNKSDDPVELKSACHLLCLAGDHASLPRIRELVKSRDAHLRREAVKTLGWLGHPEDFDRLIGQLRAKDPKELFTVVYALWEYGDRRAADKVAPLLDSNDTQLREEAISCLQRLPSPAGIDALAKYAARKKDQQIRTGIENVMKKAGITWAQWQSSTVAEKHAALDKLFPTPWKAADGAARKKLQAALVRCRKQGRLDEGLRMAAVRAEDLPLLLSARASLCRRVSDEALYEIRQIERLIQVAARIQYRADPRVCRRVEPATRPAPSRPHRPGEQRRPK